MIVDLKPIKAKDRYFNKFYIPAISDTNKPRSGRVLHRIFKRATDATNYAKRVAEKFNRLMDGKNG